MKIPYRINKKGKLVKDMRVNVSDSRGFLVGQIWLSEIVVSPCTISLSSLVEK